MTMIKVLAVACVAASALTVFADDQVRQESRTAYTQNDAVVAVSDCSFPIQYTDLLNQQRVKASFNVTTCKELKHYQANVTGKGWNSHEQAIAGTETYTYEMANETKNADQIANQNDAFQTMNVLNQCNSMREGFLTALRASGGHSKCN